MLFALALLPFAGALLLAALPNDRRRLCAWLAGAFPLAGLALVVMQAPTIMTGEVLRWSVDWVPTLASRSVSGWTASRGCSRC